MWNRSWRGVSSARPAYSNRTRRFSISHSFPSVSSLLPRPRIHSTWRRTEQRATMSPQSLTKLPISLLALLSLTSFVHGDCYVAAYGLVAKQDGYSACPGTATSPGGVETCCIPGSECGEDSICRSPNGGNNEWYVSGCTDPNYNDPLCTKNCG